MPLWLIFFLVPAEALRAPCVALTIILTQRTAALLSTLHISRSSPHSMYDVSPLTECYIYYCNSIVLALPLTQRTVSLPSLNFIMYYHYNIIIL